MAGRSRTRRAVAAAGLLVATLGCGPAAPGGAISDPASGTHPAPGGEIVVAMRTDPQSFNWLARQDAGSHVVALLTQARLVRVNRATHDLEPWLAESWIRSDDGLRFTVTLRPGIQFSDGHPLTADDVVFSIDAASDEASSLLADDLRPGGHPISATALDDRRIEVRFAGPFGPGLRILDNVPILPRHTLGRALEAGTLLEAWGVSTPPADLVGLGPFVLDSYRPGERLVFRRNPHYFRSDEHGVALPYLDRVVVEIVPDQRTHLLRFETGQLDLTIFEVAHEDYGALKRAADEGRLQLLDLGVSLNPDSFWINLRPGAFAGDPREAWIQRDELRQAISAAVDRVAFADAVYLGAGSPAYGPITEANSAWYAPDLPRPPHDPARARRLLASIGLSDADGDGLLEDSRGVPARFTLLTQRGQTSLERGAAAIRDDLRNVGLVLDVVALEGNALVQRFLSGAGYDAVYFHFGPSDTDPALAAGFWLSSGTDRVWNLAQTAPATEWERRIDELMVSQMSAVDPAERKRLFDEVQRIFAEHLPIVHFAVPKVFVAASARLTNLTPAVSRPQLLWSPDSLAVRP